MRRSLFALAVATACGSNSSHAQQIQVPNLAPARSVAEFEDHLEQLRVALRIPGYSAAIAKGTSLVWAGDLMSSSVAREFVNAFVTGTVNLPVGK